VATGSLYRLLNLGTSKIGVLACSHLKPVLIELCILNKTHTDRESEMEPYHCRQPGTSHTLVPRRRHQYNNRRV